jgi:uncharacterized protein YcbK (DUF882 family)
MSNRRLSENFTESEFRCRCCGELHSGGVPQQLIDVLQDVRNHFGQPTMVNSGFRCVRHNRNVGGAANSQHTHGRAADIRVANVDPSRVQRYLREKYTGRFGIGSMGTFTHIDIRPGGAARW